MKDKMRVDLFNKMTEYINNDKYISNVEWNKHYKNQDKYIEQSLLHLVNCDLFKELKDVTEEDYTEEDGCILDIWYDKHRFTSKKENYDFFHACITMYLRAKFINMRVEHDWYGDKHKWTNKDLLFYRYNRYTCIELYDMNEYTYVYLKSNAYKQDEANGWTNKKLFDITEMMNYIDTIRRDFEEQVEDHIANKVMYRMLEKTNKQHIITQIKLTCYNDYKVPEKIKF